MLASASVGGVALAFGAQSLVKDFLSGVFMIVEDQYGVGDVIDTGEVVGTVENVSLRVTQLRDAGGMTWYVRNGEILRVGNKTQGWSTATVDVPIAYDQDVERAISVIRDVVSVMDDDEAWSDVLLEEPEVVGIESITNGVVTIRIVAKTVANQQYGLQREMRERVKRALDAAGVRSPQPVLPPFGGGPPRAAPPAARPAPPGAPPREHVATSGRLDPVTYYDDFGGHEVFARLVHEFYRGVAQDEALRALYPEDDLGPAEERLRMFLEQYWGGPTTYSEQRGHPRLRMRHMPYAVTPDMRDRWLLHMMTAVDTLGLDAERDDRLRDYLTRAAYSLVNSGEAPDAF